MVWGIVSVILKAVIRDRAVTGATPPQPPLALATAVSALRALVFGTTTLVSPHNLCLVSADSGN